MQGQRRLAAGLRAVDLDDAAAREAADAEGNVEGDGAGRDDLDGGAALVAEAHDRALAELALDLGEGGLEGLLAVRAGGAALLGGHGLLLVCSAGGSGPVRGSERP